MSDDLDRRLTVLFREQAASIPVPPPGPVVLYAVPTRRARSTRRLLAAVGVAALACAVLAVALVGSDDGPRQVTTGPADTGAPSPDPSAGTPATTTTAPASTGQFTAETRQVALTADAVTIKAGGKEFVTVSPVSVRGDPGMPNEYTTLELTWQEHGVEMRLFIYFSSDGGQWWSNEIRTYNGAASGDWITYKGDFFRRPLGQPFTGDFTVATPDPAVGSLHFSNLRLEAFRTPSVCATARGAFALEPGTSPITIDGFSSGYGAAVHLLSTTGCTPVPDEDQYRYEWTTNDPDVVTIERHILPDLTRRADLKAGASGKATVHVTANDPRTGDVVAETDIEVMVGEQRSVPAATTLPTPPP